MGFVILFYSIPNIIECIQGNTISARNGIQWTMFKQLDYLKFADNVAKISTKQRQLQDKINILKSYTQRPY